MVASLYLVKHNTSEKLFPKLGTSIEEGFVQFILSRKKRAMGDGCSVMLDFQVIVRRATTV